MYFNTVTKVMALFRALYMEYIDLCWLMRKISSYIATKVTYVQAHIQWNNASTNRGYVI